MVCQNTKKFQHQIRCKYRNINNIETHEFTSTLRLKQWPSKNRVQNNLSCSKIYSNNSNEKEANSEWAPTFPQSFLYIVNSIDEKLLVFSDQLSKIVIVKFVNGRRTWKNYKIRKIFIKKKIGRKEKSAKFFAKCETKKLKKLNKKKIFLVTKNYKKLK